MLEITNQAKWEKTISDAIVATAENAKDERTARRWINAIERAAAMVETQSEFITWNEADQSVLVLNLETGGVYEANGVCQCEAFKRGQACKHRALAKLLKRYNEPEPQEKRLTGAEMANAPYIKPTSNYKPERVGNVRI